MSIDIREIVCSFIAHGRLLMLMPQNGGGAEWVELFITLTKGMGESMYGLLLSLITSWRSRLVQRVLHQKFFAGYSLDTRGL